VSLVATVSEVSAHADKAAAAKQQMIRDSFFLLIFLSFTQYFRKYFKKLIATVWLHYKTQHTTKW
jgi:hypothetical protein